MQETYLKSPKIEKIILPLDGKKSNNIYGVVSVYFL